MRILFFLILSHVAFSQDLAYAFVYEDVATASYRLENVVLEDNSLTVQETGFFFLRISSQYGGDVIVGDNLFKIGGTFYYGEPDSPIRLEEGTKIKWSMDDQFTITLTETP